MRKLAESFALRLEKSYVECGVYHSPTSSYVKLYDCGELRQIRFSDHEGRKDARHNYQVRKDRVTQRSKKIFAVNDIDILFNIILKEAGL